MKKQLGNCLSSSALHIVHFNNGTGGGIFSVIKNLIQYSQNPAIENHIIYTINKEEIPVFVAEHITGVTSQQVFYYSPKWNFYYTCKKLAKLLPDDKALIVAHDWLELGMMSNLGLQNSVVQFVHGDYDYYYRLARSHAPAIDKFIAVAQSIETKLLQLIPGRKSDIVYHRFPVPSISFTNSKTGEDINIIFIGRLEAAKGYPLIPVIAKKMAERHAKIQWHIAGGSGDPLSEDVVWDENIHVRFYGNIPNEQMLELLKKMQILILPSLAEGMPVAIIEAMKAGVIPIVNNIDGGIQELVINGKTGYKIYDNCLTEYVEKINELILDKSKVLRMQNNCVSLANRLFDPVNNTVMIEDFIIKIASSVNKKKYPQKIYGSRLDAKYIPNRITKLIRTFRKRRISITAFI